MRRTQLSRTGQKIGANDLAARYGVVTRSIDRWLHDQRLEFPKPIRINRRRFWDLAEIEEWERQRAGRKSA